MENKRKHLEFIEDIISRMNANSFIIKGWVITLISVLFALAARDTNIKYVLVTYIPLSMFWILDGFYLSKERRYRELYKHVSRIDESSVNFSMSTVEYNCGKNTWMHSIFSKTLIPFYGTLFVVTLIVMFLVK